MVYQYYHVKDIYEDDEYYHPKALISKEHPKFICHDSSKIKQIYGYIRGFIRSHVNEKFDDVFHKFCRNKKFPINTLVYDMSLRTAFLEMICSNKELLNVHYHYEDYYIDDKGYIRETRPNKNIPRTKFINGKEVSIHSKECKRYFAEKAWLKPLKRIRKKQLEIRHVNLIKEIEEQRKKEELELNAITRDRLGFDDASFKGEFYHGQKRKKKS